MATAPDLEESVKLQSSDGQVFEVPIQVARVSRALSIMLAGKRERVVVGVVYLPGLELGHHPDDLIPLPNVNSSILRKVSSMHAL